MGRRDGAVEAGSRGHPSPAGRRSTGGAESSLLSVVLHERLGGTTTANEPLFGPEQLSAAGDILTRRL